MNFRRLILLFFAIITGLYSCKPNGNDNVSPSDKNPPRVATVNATPDTLNVYQNNSRQNNASAIYPGGATTYLYFLRGAQNYQFKRSGTTSTLFSVPETLDSAQYYSFFVTGTTADKFFVTTDQLTVAYDTLTNDNTFTRSMIRFVNASFDAGALNVTVGTGDTVNVTNVSYGTATPFLKFNASHKQEVKVYLSNSSIAKIDTTITFQTGVIYTLFAKGSLTGTGTSAFGIGLVSNQYIFLNP